MEPEWPPVKAWTRIIPLEGFNHFVAINYGGEGNSRWVNLITVLDGNIRIRVDWSEMINQINWISGWRSYEDVNNKEFIVEKKTCYPKNNSYQSCCLHPSEDSGLQIPLKSLNIRKWKNI